MALRDGKAGDCKACSIVLIILFALNSCIFSLVSFEFLFKRRVGKDSYHISAILSPAVLILGVFAPREGVLSYF